MVRQLSGRATGAFLTTTLVVGSLMLLGPAHRADAHGGDTSVFHVCVGGRGVPRFVSPTQKCRVFETAVHWPRDLGQADSAVPRFPKAAYDANGRKIGEIVGLPPDGTSFSYIVGVSSAPIIGVRLADLNLLMTIVMTTDLGTSECRDLAESAPRPEACHRFVGTSAPDSGFTDTLWFASADCSGQPLFEVGRRGPSSSAFPLRTTIVPGGPGSTRPVFQSGVLKTKGVIVPGKVAYVTDPFAQPDTLTPGSYNAYYRDCIVNADTTARRFVPALAVDLTSIFVPPFTLR